MPIKDDSTVSEEREKILIVLHQERSTPGRIGQMLFDKGYDLDMRRPRFGEPLPETMDHHKAAIIFGGPMSANDPDDYVKKEIDWCGVPLRDDTPFLGICLGAQMLVKHLGGPVYKHPEGHVEIGYYPIRDVEAPHAQSVMPDLPSHMYQWHAEGFDLPASTALLAEGDIFENQAYKVLGSNAYGMQFHFELTLAMMYRWLVSGAHRLHLPGAQKRKAHIEGRLVHDAAARQWLDQFLDNWLAEAAS